MLAAKLLSTEISDGAQAATPYPSRRNGVGFRSGKADLADVVQEVQNEDGEGAREKEQAEENQQRERLADEIELQYNECGDANPKETGQKLVADGLLGRHEAASQGRATRRA